MHSFSQKRITLFFIPVFLVTTLFIGVVSGVSAHSTAETPIECLIVQYNACSDCVQKYRNYVKPFYDEYKENDSITFTIMDASADYTFFLEEMQRLGINAVDYGNFPWVIFFWNQTQKQVLDADDLGLINSTFESILSDVGYVPNGNNNNPDTSFDVINLLTLLIACLLIGVPLFVAFFSSQLLLNKYEKQVPLLRIEKKRFYIFSALTLISLITLTYQFLDYIQGGCGCASDDLAKILLFREYEVFNIFGLDIPFSLLGIALMIIVFCQVFLIGILPFPMEIPLLSSRTFVFTKKLGGYWYYFVVFQLFMTLGALINLLYLEIFVIHFICLLCTVSQIIIVINTFIIITWSPFKLTSSEDEPTDPIN